MAKQIRQFRYYQEPEMNKNKEIINSLNEPKELKRRELVSGEAFKNCLPIIQLGIQGLPGTKFYLNNNIYPVIIGMTGIYELNLEQKAEITALRFDNESVVAVKDNNNAYIIVDVVYDDGEG